MEVEALPDSVRTRIRDARKAGATVGVVPTMGALHAGHVSLMEAARRDCNFVVSTIFVNPTQFGPNEDFEHYPRTLKDDLQKCEAAGVDLVFTPDTQSMYTSDAETDVCVKGLTKKLEGAIRPGHFDGVTTVVAKLFNITVPDKAYFGQKDFQQQLIIKRMTQDLDWGIDVVSCPIIREHDGLAMSSRNRYLSSEERERSLSLFRTLTLAQKLADRATAPAAIAKRMSQQLESIDGLQLDYAVVANGHTLEPAQDTVENAVALLAVRLGKTRLIDNQILRFR